MKRNIASLGVSPSLENLSPHVPSSSTFSSHKVFHQVPIFNDPTISGGWRKLHKSPYIQCGGKHADTNMVMNITRNKTRTKYCKKVSQI